MSYWLRRRFAGEYWSVSGLADWSQSLLVVIAFGKFLIGTPYGRNRFSQASALVINCCLDGSDSELAIKILFDVSPYCREKKVSNTER